MANHETNPWKNGFYKSSVFNQVLLRVNGNSVEWFNFLYIDYPELKPDMTGTWKFGSFGPTSSEVKEASDGLKLNNIELTVSSWTYHGVVGASVNHIQ